MNVGKKEFLLLLTGFTASFSAVAVSVHPGAVSAGAAAGARSRVSQVVQAAPQTMTENVSDSAPLAKPEAKVVTPKLWHENHIEIAVAGGIAGVHTRDSHMQVTNTETDILAQTNSYRWDAGTGQLGIGYVFYWVDGPRISDELRWFPTFKPMLNLYYSSLNINGDIYQFNNVFLNSPRYQTSIKNTRILLDAVLAIFSKGGFSVHGLLGVGEGWSHIYYQDKIGSNIRIKLDPESETNVVWEFGAGLDYAFSRNFSMSLDYIWTDLGRMNTSSTGFTNNIVLPEISGANFQVTTQAILLGLHWGFC